MLIHFNHKPMISSDNKNNPFVDRAASNGEKKKPTDHHLQLVFDHKYALKVALGKLKRYKKN